MQDLEDTASEQMGIAPGDEQTTRDVRAAIRAQIDKASVLTAKERPEIVFGLIGPVGVDLDPVVATIREELHGAYSTDVIQLSKLIESFFGVDYQKAKLPEDKRVHHLMTLGSTLRDESGRGDAVALLAMQEISRVRDDKHGHTHAGHAYILRSLKTPEEVRLLRTVYGRGFFLVSVYAPRDTRVEAVARRIKRSMKGADGDFDKLAEVLVARDEKESGMSLGQNVQEAFPLADLFVDSLDTDRMKAQVRRFIHLVFGHRFLTPTRDEHGMQHARAAAYRSADMNRQVGAAIVNGDGDLLALGCNDVPKAGGGLYWPDDPGEDRDFKRRIDSMADHRVQVLGEVINRLHGMLKLEEGQTLSNVVQELVTGDKKSVLKGTAAMNILEFGRSVHAEMAALTTAARLGISVKDATLYCTTFPCHICARHIVASGIKRVVYIEPYTKSRAKQLHGDSISVDPERPSTTRVNFQPFEGVAPGKYFELFDAADLRKDDEGRAIEWTIVEAEPRFSRFLNTYASLEDSIVLDVIPLLRQLNLKPPTVWPHEREDKDEETQHP